MRKELAIRFNIIRDQDTVSFQIQILSCLSDWSKQSCFSLASVQNLHIFEWPGRDRNGECTSETELAGKLNISS